jgi:Di- and tripeptidases
LPVLWRDTGGGADGSNLAAYGLPNIDNLGVRGGAIHSDQEFVELASLHERVGLTLDILAAEARGELMEDSL